MINDSLQPPDSESWPPHITVATIVQRDDRFLMVEEFKHGRLVINQPAGHLEPGETLLEAAVRETREETGWLVTLQSFIGVYHYASGESSKTYLRFVFRAGPVEQLEMAIDPDIANVHWLTLDEIRQSTLRSPMVLRSMEDALGRESLPLEAIGYL